MHDAITHTVEAEVKAALIDYSGELLAQQFSIVVKPVEFKLDSPLAQAHSLIVARATGPHADVQAACHAMVQLPYVIALAISRGHEIWAYRSQPITQLEEAH